MSLTMIERDVVVKAEIIEQPRRRFLKAHHRRLSRKSAGFNESRHSPPPAIKQQTFSTVFANSGRSARPIKNGSKRPGGPVLPPVI